MEVGSSTLPGTTTNGGLAQLARAPALQAGGQRFESVILHTASTKKHTIYDILNKFSKHDEFQSGRVVPSKPSNRKENKATVLEALTYNFRQTHRGDTARSASKKGRTVDA